MSWQIASLAAVRAARRCCCFLGLPVAFSFLVINVIGAWLILGGEVGIAQMVRNCVGSVASFSLTPIPLFILMGEVLFHTGLAVKVIDGIERLIRGGARPARRGGGRGRHDLLGDLGLDHRHHRDARQPDGAADAQARLPPDDGHRPGDGDRRRGHADPAVGADRAARQPVGHLDHQASDRRHRAGADPQRGVRALHRAARATQAGPCAEERVRRIPRLAEAAAVREVRAAAGVDLHRGGGRDDRRLRHAHRVGGARRVCDRGAGDGLSRAHAEATDRKPEGHGDDLGDDPLHHHRRDHLRADPVVLGRQQRRRAGDHRPGPVDRPRS